MMRTARGGVLPRYCVLWMLLVLCVEADLANQAASTQRTGSALEPRGAEATVAMAKGNLDTTLALKKLVAAIEGRVKSRALTELTQASTGSDEWEVKKYEWTGIHDVDKVFIGVMLLIMSLLCVGIGHLSLFGEDKNDNVDPEAEFNQRGTDKFDFVRQPIRRNPRYVTVFGGAFVFMEFALLMISIGTNGAVAAAIGAIQLMLTISVMFGIDQTEHTKTT